MLADRLVWSPQQGPLPTLSGHACGRWTSFKAGLSRRSWRISQEIWFSHPVWCFKLLKCTFSDDSSLWVLLLQDLVGFFFPPIPNSRFVCAAPLSALWAKCVPLYLWQKTTLTECNLWGTFYFSISIFYFFAFKVNWMLNTLPPT